jgi:hypothetical protein
MSIGQCCAPAAGLGRVTSAEAAWRPAIRQPHVLCAARGGVSVTDSRSAARAAARESEAANHKERHSRCGTAAGDRSFYPEQLWTAHISDQTSTLTGLPRQCPPCAKHGMRVQFRLRGVAHSHICCHGSEGNRSCWAGRGKRRSTQQSGRPGSTGQEKPHEQGWSSI